MLVTLSLSHVCASVCGVLHARGRVCACCIFIVALCCACLACCVLVCGVHARTFKCVWHGSDLQPLASVLNSSQARLVAGQLCTLSVFSCIAWFIDGPAVVCVSEKVLVCLCALFSLSHSFVCVLCVVWVFVHL